MKKSPSRLAEKVFTPARPALNKLAVTAPLVILAFEQVAHDAGLVAHLLNVEASAVFHLALVCLSHDGRQRCTKTNQRRINPICGQRKSEHLLDALTSVTQFGRLVKVTRIREVIFENSNLRNVMVNVAGGRS